MREQVLAYLNKNGKDSGIYENVIFQDDGDGVYIKEWKYTDLSEPTDSDLSQITESEVNQVIFSEQKKAYQYAIQRELDKKAVELGFDSIVTAVTYADEPAIPKFQSDGKALRAWRSEMWAYAYQVESDVIGGAEIPEMEDFIANAPAFAG